MIVSSMGVCSDCLRVGSHHAIVYNCSSFSLHYIILYNSASNSFVVFTYVTRFVKKGHNHTSLNLQYKALNTLGEILAYH